MSMRLQRSIGRGIAALAVTLAVSTPAAADHWRGYPGMAHGHPHCQNYPGAHPGACPYMRGMADPAPMSGKVLGVHISDLPNAMLDAANVGYGVSVEHVRPDTPAAAAGIRAGDLIVEFAGKPVLSGDRLRWLVRKAEAGKNLEVKLMREGSPVTVSVALPEARPKEKCDVKETPKLGT